MRYLLQCACNEIPYYSGPVRAGCSWDFPLYKRKKFFI